MQCELLTSETAFAALAPEWEALQQRCGRSLFTGLPWCEGWWVHLGKQAGARLHLATGRREGRLVAVAPLCVVRHKGIRVLEWAGGIVCDYGDFLLEDAQDAVPLWDAIRRSPHYDLARIRDIHPASLCLPALARFARRTGTSPARNIRIEWPAFEAWLASLPYAARKQYRARVKQAEAVAPLRYDVVREGPSFDRALAALVEQKAAWAKAQGVSSVFDAPGAAGFFRHIAQAESAGGRLHLSTLSCGEEIIATHMGFVCQGAFMSYMPTYSAQRSALSPGRIMLFKCIGWAIENGCTEYDFMRGEEGYKNTFATGARELQDFMFARTMPGRLAEFYLRRKLLKGEPR